MGPSVTEQLKSTLPVKPPLGVIDTVDVALGPGDGMVTAVLLSVKLGGAAGTVTAADVEAGGKPPEASAAVMVMEY
jgi:hypothetical protein